MAGPSLTELPPSAIRLIGSGQVITSVFSVVKELAENSFDAGCTSLDIKLEGYGLEKIEICDNGHGIKTVDVPFVAKRHYTSKLVSVDDLQTLETYGFRGEALASLCAVSEVTIATKTVEDDVSYIYDIDNEGNIKSKKPSHLGTGTTATACHLFYNLPVRKQFYSSSQRRKDDLKRIEDLLIAFGIIRPQLRVTLRHGRDIVWQKIPVNDTKGALQSVLGRQVFSQLLYDAKVLEEIQGSVCAYLPKPGSNVKMMSRSTGDRVFIVVNERPVYVKELIKLLKQYYNNCHACDTTRYPICCVLVKLPSSDVDVNLEPNKTTVLLKHLNEVCTCLEEILLKVYGPLDNVSSWHYSDSAKASGEQKNGENNCNVGSKVLNYVKRKTSEKPVKDDVGDVLDIPCNTDTSNSEQETVVNRSEPLPSFNLKFHGHYPTSSSCSGLRPETECLEHRKAEDVPEFGLAGNKLDQNSIEACVYHVHYSKLSNNLTNEEPMTKLLNRSSGLESDLGISKTNDQLDVPDQSFSLKAIDASQSKQQSYDTNQTLNCDLVKDSSDSMQVNTGNKTPLINDSSWSLGQGFLSSSGQQLQPVKLLSLSSVKNPGKRPLSTAGSPSGCPPKQRKMSSETLLPGQSTLNDSWFDQSAAFELFCTSKQPTMLESNADDGSEGINEMLLDTWKNLSSDERMKCREKSLSDTRRQETKITSLTGIKSNKTSDSTKANLSEPAAKTSQKKILKRRLYHSEKRLHCDIRCLRAAVVNRDADSFSNFKVPTVIGQAVSCDAWLCKQAGKLCLINIYRLGEAILYKNLKDKHRLLAKPWESPVSLKSLLMNGNQWQTLEKLAIDSESKNAYFHISDERLVSNGFNIRCHRDSEESLQAELVGLCDLVPSYNISDLSEVLEMISRKPDVALGDARPTKALYYLQGEVYRILQTNLCNKSLKDIQEMINQLSEVSYSAVCIHHKPIFHELFDLSEVNQVSPPAMEAQE